jgi:hypothetical protein
VFGVIHQGVEHRRQAQAYCSRQKEECKYQSIANCGFMIAGSEVSIDYAFNGKEKRRWYQVRKDIHSLVV